MITPPYLKKGDAVGIVAPARWIEQEKYESIISIIEKQGFNPIRGKTTYLTHGPFAGTDAERLGDMQSMLDNTDIKALFCLRGGYGTIRIIEDLDFTRFKQNPKWIIGFSDITILHNALHNMNVASIHGQMPLNFSGRSDNKGLDTLFNVLVGKPLTYSLDSHPLNKMGEASGELVGGNVAILCSLIGTPLDINTEGKILFIEEVGEYLYRFDRLMHHLKMSGKLSQLAGLIIGGLTDMKDNEPAFGLSVAEIVAHVVKDYTYPVCFDFPAGHIKENYPLILGAKSQLRVTSHKSEILFETP